MITYQQLANHIRANAITRGKTKGNAPVNRVVHSAREFIRYENGEGSSISGYQFGYDDRYKMFTMTPEGVLTVHQDIYSCPSEYGFMDRAAGLHFMTKTIKGSSQRAVCAEPSAGWFVAYKGMAFNPNGTCRKPLEFTGWRMNKEATAAQRQKLKLFGDIFALWLQPDPQTQHRFVRTNEPFEVMLANESMWDKLCEAVYALGHQKYIHSSWDYKNNKRSFNVDPRFYQPKAYIKELLMPRVAVYETYGTGLYNIPVKA